MSSKPKNPTEWHVKVRNKNGKAWWFLTSSSGMNRLRIHAAIFTDKARAEAVVDEINRENPDVEAKVVDA